VGRKRFVAVVIVLLVLIAVTRVLLTYKVTAQGFDEPGHVAAAIELLDHGTYTLDPLHPPAHPHRNWNPTLPGRGTIPQLAHK